MKWMQIDSAPKTGEVILVCLPRQMNLIVRARYNTIHKHWVTDHNESGIVRPTFFHVGDLWQDMPEPPEKEKKCN